MREAFRQHDRATVPATVAAIRGPPTCRVHQAGLPLLLAALGVLAALAGCVKEPQPRATVLRELDSGYTSSNGGGMGYLDNQVNVGTTTRVK